MPNFRGGLPQMPDKIRISPKAMLATWVAWPLDEKGPARRAGPFLAGAAAGVGPQGYLLVLAFFSIQAPVFLMSWPAPSIVLHAAASSGRNNSAAVSRA